MNIRTFCLLIILFFSFSSVASADAEGVALFSVGNAVTEKDAFSGEDNGFKVGSGFRVTESSGIELYWSRYGEPQDTVSFPALGAPGVTVDISSLTFQYVHFFPLAGSLDVLVRIGAAFWSSEFDVKDINTFTDDGIGTVGGLGAELKITEGLALRVEWERSILGNFTVDFASVGIASYFE